MEYQQDIEDMEAVKISKRQWVWLSALSLVCGLLWFVVPKVQRTWRIANPVAQNLQLPESLVALNTPSGQRRLKESTARVDYNTLMQVFEPQVYLSYCGVASGVMVENALSQSKKRTQSNWFEQRAEGSRTQYETFYGGMTLAQFDTLMGGGGLKTKRYHGGGFTLDDFRRRVLLNLENARDTLVVNYSRKGLKQKGGGHFSPLAAYHHQSDSVLILDVAEHKYPPVWAPLRALWRAMDTVDSDSQKTRGFIEVALPTAPSR